MMNKLNLKSIKHDDYESTQISVGIFINGKYYKCSIILSLNDFPKGSKTIIFVLAGAFLLSIAGEGDIYLHNKLIFSPVSDFSSYYVNDIPQELPEIINVLSIFKKAFEHDPMCKDIIEDTFTMIKQHIIL